MSKAVSPCKDCGSRRPGCHDSCDAFKAWKLQEKYKTFLDDYKRLCYNNFNRGKNRSQ